MQAAFLLRSARRAVGLTQRQLADQPVCHRRRWDGSIQADHAPRVDTLDNLLRATGQELSNGCAPGAGIDVARSARSCASLRAAPSIWLPAMRQAWAG